MSDFLSAPAYICVEILLQAMISKDFNAVDEATKEVKSYVGTIKRNYEIGGKYMTVGDLMDKIAAEAAAEVAEEMGAIIAQNEATIAQKDKTIAQKDETIAQKDETIVEKDAEIAELKKKLSLLDD